MIQGVRTYQAPAATVGIRRRVITGHAASLSKNMIRSMALVVGITAIAVLAVGQLFSMGVDRNLETLSQLQAVHKTVENENISLLAVRARLLSESHIKAVAAARLQLFENTNQVHHL